VYDEGLLSIVEEFVLGMGWEGPFEVEFIRNDGYHLIEMNSRFPSWIDVCVGTWLNLPAVLAELLYGKRSEIKDRTYKTDVAFIKFPTNAITDIDRIVSMNIGRAIEWNENNM
jgi:hypothetical protein